MKIHAAVLFLQALIGIGILLGSNYTRARDNERKAHLEATLSLPRTTVQVATLSDKTIQKQFDADVSLLKDVYWTYLKDEEKANQGAYAAAMTLIISALLHSIFIYLRTARSR